MQIADDAQFVIGAGNAYAAGVQPAGSSKDASVVTDAKITEMALTHPALTVGMRLGTPETAGCRSATIFVLNLG